MKYVSGTIAVVLLVAMLVFSIQNRAAVEISFFWWSFSTPKVFLILGTYLIGMFSGWGFIELAKRAMD